jgi:hypothetical protein
VGSHEPNCRTVTLSDKKLAVILSDKKLAVILSDKKLAVILSEVGRASRGPRVEGPAVAFAFAFRKPHQTAIWVPQVSILRPGKLECTSTNSCGQKPGHS